MTRKIWDGVEWRRRGQAPTPPTNDYTDANPPWRTDASTQDAREAEYLAGWPAGWGSPPRIVDLQTGAATFRQNVLNTIAASGRCVIRLGEGVHHLTSFVAAVGDDMYAFGLWHPNLAGFFGAGPGKTIIQMDADSLNATQLAGIQSMTKASGQVLQLAVMRIDGDQASPAVLAGLTMQSADQQMVSLAADNGVVSPQPAPHNGLTLFRRTGSATCWAYLSHVQFLGFGRACTSLPPFECTNVGSQREHVEYHHVESDGRRAASLDPARPRRCGVMMGNNAYHHRLNRVWLHHTNVSRYAANDQNLDTSGDYIVEASKIEQISNNRNSDPALNNGNSLGGYTDATPLGWESCNGTITVNDTIISQDNPNTTVGFPAIFQLTAVGNRNPQGGRFHAHGNTYRCPVWPWLDGYACFRIMPDTPWWTDGFATTLDVRASAVGPRLTPWVYTGTWPPSQASLAAAGIAPETHYIVRRT